MPAASPPIILTFKEARRAVEEHAAQVSDPAIDAVNLLDSAGRVLAEPVVADRDVPPFPRATRDGYAVRSEDLSTLPTLLNVIGEIKAGEKLEDIPATVKRGETVSIMTGAPVPDGTDAVVMVEYTSLDGNQIEITKSVERGENIIPRGAEAREGSTLLDCGQLMTAATVALAASVGKPTLSVYKKPRVAVLTTGDEIVDVGTTPGPTQIRNSNTYSLVVQIRKAGGEPVLLPIAPDEPQQLHELIEQGLQSDLLLMTGGVSMGRYDLVEQVLSEMKAEFFFTGAKIQPGRPLVFGRCSEYGSVNSRNSGTGTYFFGLPGNPVSTMVTFELFVRSMIEALAGQIPRKLMFTHALLKTEIRVKTGLTRFLPANLSGEFGNTNVEQVPWQGSGDIVATARANCYVVIPPDREHIPEGEWIAVLMR